MIDHTPGWIMSRCTCAHARGAMARSILGEGVVYNCRPHPRPLTGLVSFPNGAGHETMTGCGDHLVELDVVYTDFLHCNKETESDSMLWLTSQRYLLFLV